MGFFHSYSLCQEAQPAVTEEGIERRTKKRETDERRRLHIDEKSYTVVEM